LSPYPAPLNRSPVEPSQSNTDDREVVENAPVLASEYAVYIMNVYGHNKWMFNQFIPEQGATDAEKAASPQYDGNQGSDVGNNGMRGGRIALNSIFGWETDPCGGKTGLCGPDGSWRA
jgi:hypothetical protein